MPGVNLEFIMHRLNVDPLFLPKKQKQRLSTKHHMEAVKEEVEKLKHSGARVLSGLVGYYYGGKDEE